MMNNQNLRAELFRKRIPLYRKDIVLFGREQLKFEPDEWQVDVFRDMADSRRVSVKSGQGVGKTGCEAIIALWFLSCFPFAKVVATAPTLQQLNDVLWAEIDKWLSRSPVLNEILSWTKTYIYFKGYAKRWFATARTATRPENMQGFHEDNMLFIIDEASGIAEPIMEAILGTLSGANNKLLMCGNPTKTSGTFYDSHTTDRALYRCHTVNSENSPRTNKDNIAALARKYGKNSNVYRVRVSGEFPENEDDVFIPLSLIETAVMTDAFTEILKISVGVDVARFGDDETVIAVNAGGNISLPCITHGQNLMRTVGDIVQTYYQLIKKYPEYTGVITFNIDDTGLGGGVTDRLNEVKIEEQLWRMEIVPVNFGEAPPQDDTDEHYQNMSTYLWAQVKNRLHENSLHIDSDPNHNDNELVAQLSSRKYSLTSKGRIVLESKDDMKKRSLGSPDRGDAVALSCFEKRMVYSMFTEKSAGIFIAEKAAAEMQKAFDGINIGIALGNAPKGVALVATAVSDDYSKVVVLKAIRVPGDLETEKLGAEFVALCMEILAKYKTIDYCYCDSDEAFLKKCLRASAEKASLPVSVRSVEENEETDRIRLTTRLIAQNRLLMTDKCIPLAQAMSTATWDERNRSKDTRSESSDVGMLNAFEYSIKRYGSRLINSETNTP